MKNHAILAGIAIAALTAAPAFAQTTTPDPTLTETFKTDGNGTTGPNGAGFVSPATFASFSKGVGFTPANPNNAFVNAQSRQTAQSIYNPFILGNTITAGSTLQIGVHAFANNETTPGSPVTIFTSIFNYDPNAAAGTVPIIGPAIVNNAPILITSSGTNTAQADVVYFTGDITLPSTLSAGVAGTGPKYVIAFAPDTTAGGTPADFAIIFGKSFSQSGLPSNEQADFQNVYLTDANTANTGGAFTLDATSGNASSPAAYRFYSGASVPAPEPSSTTPLLIGGLAIGLLAWKRSRRAC